MFQQSHRFLLSRASLAQSLLVLLVLLFSTQGQFPPIFWDSGNTNNNVVSPLLNLFDP